MHKIACCIPIVTMYLGLQLRAADFPPALVMPVGAVALVSAVFSGLGYRVLKTLAGEAGKQFLRPLQWLGIAIMLLESLPLMLFWNTLYPSIQASLVVEIFLVISLAWDLRKKG